MKHIAKLHYITHPLADYPIARQVEDVCAGGCKWVQLRMKNASAEERLTQALAIQPLLKRYGAKLIINDDVSVARVLDSDGVHIGKEDIHPIEARQLLGPKKIIGCTANTLEDVLRLSQYDIDYIGIGPFRFTSTKEKLSPVLGSAGIQRIVQAARARDIHIPFIAIGGIQGKDLDVLLDMDVHGVALSATIHQAPDNVSACKAIIEALKEPARLYTDYSQ